MKTRYFQGIKYSFVSLAYKRRSDKSVLLILAIISDGRLGTFTADLRITERFKRFSSLLPQSFRQERMFEAYRHKFREQMIEWF